MEKLEWTGERFLPEVEGDVQIEHMHRYALALKLVEGHSVLDIACGEGYGSNILAGKAASVVGVDICEDAVRHAREKYIRKNLNFIQGDCTDIPLGDASVEVVVSFETIEHHDQHDEFLSEIKRVLVPGGLLIISSPDRREYSDVTGYDNEYHVKELYLSEFDALLKQHFSYQTLLGQRIKYGSLIVPLCFETGVDFISHKRDVKGIFHQEEALFDPMYFVALASDGDIPEVVSSIYEHPVESSEIVRRVTGLLENREGELHQLNADHKVLLKKHDGLEKKYRELGKAHEQTKTDLERREADIEKIFNSTSWRITSPIRFVRRIIGQGAAKIYSLGAASLQSYASTVVGKTRTSVRTIGGFRQIVFKSIDIVRYRDMDRLKEAFSRHAGHMVGHENGLGEGEKKVACDPCLLSGLVQPKERDDEYVPFQAHQPVNTDIRLIAFYLPQFHPIKENDQAWGKGFTEWTNVSKAMPQYLGHDQPKLPGELGFYDLRLGEVHRRQIELAKNYGIHGFCYHYYWFNGKKVLDLPIKRIMENPDMDFPFCINWANENWTKRWDGLDKEVILKQNHSPEDDLAFIREVEPLLKDSRYIRVDGRPLLMIYRASLFPDIKQTADRWREHCRECGIGEIYLVITHAHGHMEPTAIGFDAATEFAPNTFSVREISSKFQFLNQNFQGHVFDFSDAIHYSMRMRKPSYMQFRSLCPGWDNEPRKPGKGNIFHGASPEKFATWLDFLLHDTQKHQEGSNRLVFINAWNEWAEGAFLEPDQRYGYAYLDRTYRCLARFDHDRQKYLVGTQCAEKASDIAVVLHLYFTELWDEMCSSLDSLVGIDFDLYISINPDAGKRNIDSILRRFPKARIFSFENRGRDILPFIELFQRIYPLNYKYVCKIHSKKSGHRKDRDRWRNKLLCGLLGSKEKVRENLHILEQEARTGMLVSKGNIFTYETRMGTNEQMIRDYAKKNNLDFDRSVTFPSGSMFWFKPIALKQLIDTIPPELFEMESGQLDGTMAHSAERIFGLLCHANGYALKEV